jgi:hypothetical protein
MLCQISFSILIINMICAYTPIFQMIALFPIFKERNRVTKYFIYHNFSLFTTRAITQGDLYPTSDLKYLQNKWSKAKFELDL